MKCHKKEDFWIKFRIETISWFCDTYNSELRFSIKCDQHSCHNDDMMTAFNLAFYIIVLCQLQLIELSRFQYYLDCDHMFVLFNLIKSYWVLHLQSPISSILTDFQSSITAHKAVFIMFMKQRLSHLISNIACLETHYRKIIYRVSVNHNSTCNRSWSH